MRDARLSPGDLVRTQIQKGHRFLAADESLSRAQAVYATEWQRVVKREGTLRWKGVSTCVYQAAHTHTHTTTPVPRTHTHSCDTYTRPHSHSVTYPTAFKQPRFVHMGDGDARRVILVHAEV